jgi:hypothetical protein
MHRYLLLTSLGSLHGPDHIQVTSFLEVDFGPRFFFTAFRERSVTNQNKTNTLSLVGDRDPQWKDPGSRMFGTAHSDIITNLTIFSRRPFLLNSLSIFTPTNSHIAPQVHKLGTTSFPTDYFPHRSFATSHIPTLHPGRSLEPISREAWRR